MTRQDVTAYAVLAAGAAGIWWWASRPGSAPASPTAATVPTSSTPSSPATVLNQYLATPSPPPGFPGPTPAGISLALSVTSAPPYQVGQSIRVTALAQGLAAYNQALIDQGHIGVGQFGATWQWVARTPSGVAAQRLTQTGNATETFHFVPTSPGAWTVTATVTVRGVQTGPGIITIPVGGATGSLPPGLYQVGSGAVITLAPPYQPGTATPF